VARVHPASAGPAETSTEAAAPTQADPPQVILLGANHKSAPVELRERFFLKPDPIREALQDIASRHDLAELAVLSTCNRFELIGVARPDAAPNPERLLRAWMELHQREKSDSLAAETIRASTYELTGEDAIRHMFTVAASLDSMIVGETQITGQFKDAVSTAQAVGTLGPLLSRLAQDALAAAKKVRSQTAIGRKSVSISSAAIDLARKVFGDLSTQRFAVIGAGDMAAIAARHILAATPKHLTIVNRTMERAEALTKDLGAGQPADLSEIFSVMCQCDVLISSTSAAAIIIDRNLVNRVQNARRGKPLLLIDIALPRDIDPAAGEIEDVYLFDIDDLQQVIQQNTKEREDARDAAQVIITEGVLSFRKWLATSIAKPSLESLNAYLDRIVKRESQKTLSKEVLRSLDAKQIQAIEAMLTAITGRISGDVAIGLRDLIERGSGETAAGVINHLFPERPDAGENKG